jgi:hypothetical protein
MPFVSGWLHVRRRPGHPDQGLPGGEGEVDPGYGVDLGGHPDQGLPGGGWGGPVDPGFGHPGFGGPHPGHGLPIPRPPPGIWPGPTPGHPIAPVPPEDGGGAPGQLPSPPAGTIWPPTAPPGVDGKFWVLCFVPEYGWKFICVEIGGPEVWPPIDYNKPPKPQPK